MEINIKRIVRCMVHGEVILTSEQYNYQMDRENMGWFCPICGSSAFWAGEFFDCLDPNCDGTTCVDTDTCDKCGKNQEELYMNMSGKDNED